MPGLIRETYLPRFAGCAISRPRRRWGGQAANRNGTGADDDSENQPCCTPRRTLLRLERGATREHDGEWQGMKIRAVSIKSGDYQNRNLKWYEAYSLENTSELTRLKLSKSSFVFVGELEKTKGEDA